jgi:hypothetical protein
VTFSQDTSRNWGNLARLGCNSTLITTTTGTFSCVVTTVANGTWLNDGEYTLALGGWSSGAIRWNASIAQVKAAVELMDATEVQGVQVLRSTVARTGGYTWTVYFGYPRGNLALMTVASNTLSYGGVTTDVSITVGDDQYEVQVVTMTGGTGGSFTLTLDTRTCVLCPKFISTTDTIRPSALASDSDSLEKRLAAILEIQGVTDGVVISRTAGGVGAVTWTITFAGVDMRGNIAQMVPDFALLTGTTPNVGVSTTFNGRQLSASERHGNSVDGVFRLMMCVAAVGCATSGNLDAQWDAATMNTPLSTLLSSIVPTATVVVTRSGPKPNAGNTWEWSVTFNSALTGGDIPEMVITSESGLTGTNAHANVREQIKGNELGGTWQVLFLGQLSPLMDFNATALQVQTALQKMVTIDARPGYLNVTRNQVNSGSIPHLTQVKGYSWSITFLSNIHDGVDTYEVWDGVHEGFIKSWGKNVGNLPAMSCVTAGAPLLTTTNRLGTAHCDVCHAHVGSTCHNGTLPLSGTFTLTYDTSACHPDACAVRGNFTTRPLLHNAPATRAQAAAIVPRVLSVQEALEEGAGVGLPNIGLVNVVRSAVDNTTGGYTWTVTFLHDTSVNNTRCSSSTWAQCPAVGNAYDLYVDGNGLVGTSKATSQAEVRRGNILRGFFTLTLDGTTTATMPWDISAAAMDRVLEANWTTTAAAVKRVEVSRTQQGLYGAFTWNITFTENELQTPTGTGDRNMVVIDNTTMVESAFGACGACAGRSTSFRVVETIKGSDGLDTTYTITLNGGSVLGPVSIVVAFDELPSVLETNIETALSNTFDVFITRREFLEGWQGIAVPYDGFTHLGGYEWNITFLKVPGDYSLAAFPPGSGDVPAILMDDSALVGEMASVAVVERVNGSIPLTLPFTLSHGAFSTLSSIAYKATDVEMATAIGDIGDVDFVNVTRIDRMTGVLPGTVSVPTFSATMTTTADLRPYLRRGQAVRIGGGTGGPMVSPTTNLPGSNGDTVLPGVTFNVDHDAVVAFNASTNVRRLLLVGDTLRLRGQTFRVTSTGTGIRNVFVANSGGTAFSTGNGFAIRVGTTDTTACLEWDASESAVHYAVNNLTAVVTNGGVTVTRVTAASLAGVGLTVTGAPAGLLHVYLVRFDGAGWNSGNVVFTLQNALSGACAGGATTGTITTAVNSDIDTVGVANTVFVSPAYMGPPVQGVLGYRVAEVAVVSMDTGRTFSATQVPLAPVSNSAGLFWSLRALSTLSAYRVDGLTWFVTFPSALGNVPPLTSSSPRVITTDDVFTASLPLAYTVQGLYPGVPYYFTVQAETVEGLSVPSSPPVRQLPRGVPQSPAAFDLDRVDHRNEMQTITTAARFTNEVQVIRTFAEAIPEVQITTVDSTTGSFLSSTANFEVTLDGLSTAMEKQALTASTTGRVTAGGQWRITMPALSVTALCVAVGITADALETAIETAAGGGANVEVFRSGGGNAASNYGYSYTIVYVSSGVSNVAQWSADQAGGCTSVPTLTFTPSTVDNGGIDIPYNAAPAALTAEMAKMPNIGSVNTLQSVPNARGGSEWTVTLLSLPADVTSMTCSGDAAFNAVTGSGCSVTTLSNGNVIGGYFLLELGAETNHVQVPHNADEATMKARLEEMTSIGTVNVQRVGPTTEDGYTWSITFLDNYGDVELLQTLPSLTGTNPRMSVTEAVKGNWLGGQFKVTVAATQEHEYIAYNALASDVEAALERMASIGGVAVVRSGPDTQRGYVWTITFLDDRVNPGNVDALVVEDTLLTGVNKTVYVREVVNGSQPSGRELRVSFAAPLSTNGDPLVSYEVSWSTAYPVSASNSKYGIALVTDRDMLFRVRTLTISGGASAVSGAVQFKYKNIISQQIIYAVSATGMRNALEAMASIGAVTVEKPLSTSTTSTWIITFHTASPATLAGITVESVTLSPSTATINIVGGACNGCYYIRSLAERDTVYAQVRAWNSIGVSATATQDSAVARRIPGKPANPELFVISGSELEVKFGKSADGGDDILRYCLEWDIVESFNSGSSGACGGNALGSEVVSGAIIAGSSPYYAVIGGLFANTTYFVRISAENSVPFEYLTIGSNISNREWEVTTPRSATPQFLIPKKPDNAEVVVIGGDTIRIYFEEPARTGGRTIVSYIIDWDPASTFDSSAVRLPLGTVNVTIANLEKLGNVYFYDVSGLTAAVPYYFRVTAFAEYIGKGEVALALPQPLAPVRSPYAPRYLEVTTADVQPLAPITHLDVQWDSPASTGGDAITQYRVETWHANIIKEVVQVEVTGPSSGVAPTGHFRLSIWGQTTNQLAVDASTAQVRYELMNLRTTALVQLVGDVTVTRSALLGAGYRYSITFNDQARNAGKQPKMSGALTSGSTGNILVSRIINGVRSGGRNEVGRIVTSNANDNRIGGYFRVSFDSSGWSPYLPHDVSADFLTKVLQNFVTTGIVSVTRNQVNSTLDAYEWLVEFQTNEPRPNVPRMEVDGMALTPLLQATVTAYDGKNDETVASSQLLCPSCAESELPAGYVVTEVPATTFAHHFTGLVPGEDYTVRVTAKNSRGWGTPAVHAAVRLPLQVPSAPTNLSVGVRPGYTTDLLVTFAPPVSDGGVNVTKYTIEWDTSPDFTHLGTIDYRCPNFPVYELVTVRTSTSDNSAITGGYFRLTVTTRGYAASTRQIVFNSSANAADETIGLDIASDLEPTGASLMSRLEELGNVDSVRISRQNGAYAGHYTWTITFLDLGDIGAVTIAQNALTGAGATPSITIANPVQGQAFTQCYGTLPIAPLVQQPYFVRVFAYNKIGFGPSVATTRAYKPMVVPGAPSSVSLFSKSGSQLKVVFGAPESNGGDGNLTYR